MKSMRERFDRGKGGGSPQETKLSFRVPETPALGGRLVDMGIDTIEVFQRMLEMNLIQVPASLITALGTADGTASEQDVRSFLRQIEEKSGKCAPGMSRGMREQQMAAYILSQLLCILTVVLETCQRCPHDLERAMVAILDLVKTVPHFLHYTPIARLVGLHFSDYTKTLEMDRYLSLKRDLLDIYPLYLLPSSSVADAEVNALATPSWKLSDPLSLDGIHLCSAPFRLNHYSQTPDSYDLGTCSNAEPYHVSASELNGKAAAILYQGELMGGLKFENERTFVALRSCVQDGRYVLVRGGLYQFHGLRFDEEKSVVELSDVPGPIKMVPLRMWERISVSKLDIVEERYNERLTF